MSKKYVPSFLKDQQSQPQSNTTSNNSSSFWPGQNSSSTNKFAPLSDDFPMNKQEKPIVNTSLPAKQAPKLAPATLASLTSNGSTAGSKKSFASKFAEQVKIAEDPNYVPPPKPVDFKSEEDFPSLGGPKKPVATGAWGAKPVVKNEVVEAKPEGPSFADKAREWARKKEEDEEKARRRALRQERMKREAELIRTIPMMGFRRRQEYDEDEDDDYNDNYNDGSSLGDDSYEIPSEDESPEEDEDENEDGEFNQNVGWDGRRRDDLY
jgi:hypothetical protein